MLTFEQILQRIETELSGLRFTHPPQSLYEPITYILSLGGKRIRPALTLMACNMYRDDIDIAVAPALGMEVFHNFTLLHDDLMDNADKRRNKPTVHTVWDANTAILSGDAMLIVAYRLIGQTDPAFLPAILPLFTRTALEICEGQQYDMEFESRLDVSQAEYMEMIRLKTAVLLACCLKTGAILGGAPEADADHLYAFGIHIGLAFQLQDDLLDVYGDPQVFGKNIGGDILCNKKTFLLIEALEGSSEAQRDILTAWMKQADGDPDEKIAAFTYIYNVLRIKEHTEARMNEHYEAAFRHLDAVQAAPEKKKILNAVCNNLMHRTC